MIRPKPLSELTISEMDLYPVWEYVIDDRYDEFYIIPVPRLPVTSLKTRFICTDITTHSRNRYRAILDNIDLTDQLMTDTFLSATIIIDDEWFTLARYFDITYDLNGPSQLSENLKLNIEDIFPIEYDISSIVSGSHINTIGYIPLKPSIILPIDDIIKMSVR